MSAEPLHKTLWQENQALAEECLAHPFVRGLGDGSLDPEAFKHYLAQDAFFLQAFFSAYALGAVRAVERRQVVQRLHGLMGGVLDELAEGTHGVSQAYRYAMRCELDFFSASLDEGAVDAHSI